MDRSRASGPLAYLITFRTYGTWVHGDARGSVSRRGIRDFGAPAIQPHPGRQVFELGQLRSPPVIFDQVPRMAVAGAISEVCDIRGWTLAALNVRTNHLHAVVAANTAPERIMLDFKSYATRRLRRDGLSRPGSPVWARGGSTKYLWQHAHVAAAIRYATFDQGEDIGGLRTFDETSPC